MKQKEAPKTGAKSTSARRSRFVQRHRKLQPETSAAAPAVLPTPAAPAPAPRPQRRPPRGPAAPSRSPPPPSPPPGPQTAISLNELFNEPDQGVVSQRHRAANRPPLPGIGRGVESLLQDGLLGSLLMPQTARTETIAAFITAPPANSDDDQSPMNCNWGDTAPSPSAWKAARLHIFKARASSILPWSSHPTHCSHAGTQLIARELDVTQ